MKIKLHKKLKTGLFAAACGLTLLGSVSTGLAQNTNATNSFDTASSTTSFVQWWGTANMTWDSTKDAANDANSGSVQYSCPFVGAGGEQFMTFFTIANRWQWDGGYILDATAYTNMAFDIKVDPASPITPGGNYGTLEVGLVTDGWGTTYLPAYTIPLSATNWTHVNQPLTPSLVNIDKVVGYFIKMWSNGAHTNTLIINFDNVMYQQSAAPVIIPPPTVSLIKSQTKLNLLASGTGQYDRQQIRTTDSTYGWVGSPDAVTYEVTIKDGPGAGSPGYQAHIFLAANDNDGSPSIDWNATNLIWLHIEQLGNGGGQANIRYKTNRPQGNDMLFNADPAATNQLGNLIGVGSLGAIVSTNMVGTWKLTLANDTNITVTTADGTTTNVNISADAAALFNGTVRAFFGGQPNNLAYGGRGFAFDQVKISTINSTLIEDGFTGGTLDALKWTVQASDAPGVFVVPTNSTYSLSWTLPASGFSPQIGTNLNPGSNWKSPLLTTERQITTNKRVVLTDPELDSNAAYFRLLKRVVSQLQVLLPGETNAPNTLTGKVGTPDPVTLGGFTTVTINAVDSTWNIVSSGSGMINLTSTDGTAIMPLDASLVSGTLQQLVQFGSTGSWTVTATNTSTTLPAATSASVNVVP